MTLEEFKTEWYSDSLHIKATTSGSTGVPKTIFLPKSVVTLSAQRTIDFFGLRTGMRLHIPLAFDYIAAKMMAVRAWISGANLTWENPSNQPLLPQNTDNKTPIDLLAVVPSQLDSLLSRYNNGELPSINNIIVGGSAIPQNIRERLSETEIIAWETYGMTETASHVALRRVTKDFLLPFTPLPGIYIKTRKEGRIQINLNDGLTEPILTNDIAEILPDGRFRLLGRTDNVIISGGLKIHPALLEQKIGNVLNDYPEIQNSISDFYITSRKDNLWGDRVVLAIEGTAWSKNIQQYILEIFRNILPKHEVPKEIVFFQLFERTTTGKIKRITLS